MNELIRLHETTKKMREYKTDDLVDIIKQFHGLAVLMGLKEISPSECAFMVQFVQKEFKDFSFDEIKEAFMMNLAGKLEKKVEPYGSFNINYVSNVLVYYRKKRGFQLSEQNRLKQLPEPTEAEKKKQADEMYNEIFIELNEKFKKGVREFTYDENIKYFDCLKNFELMPEYNDAKLWNDAKEEYLKRLNGSTDRESRKIFNSKGSTQSLSEKLQSRFKKGATGIYKGFLVTRYLVEICEFCDDLNELINE
jgi:hypothetical protein